MHYFIKLQAIFSAVLGQNWISQLMDTFHYNLPCLCFGFGNRVYAFSYFMHCKIVKFLYRLHPDVCCHNSGTVDEGNNVSRYLWQETL